MFNILFLFSGHDSAYPLKETRLELEQAFPGEFLLEFMDMWEIDGTKACFNHCRETLAQSDLVFIIIHGGITYFKSFDSLFQEFKGHKKFFIHSGMEDENNELLKDSGLPREVYYKILEYYLLGGSRNNRNMLLYAAATLGSAQLAFSTPEQVCWEGIYYPGGAVPDHREYLEKARASGKPVIGLLFYSKYFHENNLQHIDFFIRELELCGGFPLAVYTGSTSNPGLGCRGLLWTIENLLQIEGKPVVDVVINTMAFAQSIMSSPGDGSAQVDSSVFEPLGVPVLQAMHTYQSLESWQSSVRGLDSMSLASSVYYPEFDGQLITAPFAYRTLEQDFAGEKPVFKPITERVEKISHLAMNWAVLRRTPQSEKRVAIIFHNMPPRNDMIGCAFGLDSPRTVWNLVNALQNEGVYTEYFFTDGDEIINRIINAVSNDTRWLPADKALERSVDIINGRTYREWFANLAPAVQQKMIHDWGEPPGEFMVQDDRLPVPGILNGNVFIGLQPPRGYEEKAEEVYHSTDIVPPHQYLAFYGWVKNIFKAHVIVHIGTHGTLEWLPGKEIGLSNECYPDIAIGEIPHLYLYIIDVPGEGIQVKRRSYGIILDHLIPSLVQSGTYDEMAQLDSLLAQYYQSRQADPGKLGILQEQIITLAVKGNFHQDFGYDADRMRQDFTGFLEKLHAWIEEIKNSLIKDGLHIYGQVPQAERLLNLIKALLRLRNGNIPALPEAISQFYGLNYASLKDNPLETGPDGRTNFMRLDDLEAKGAELLTGLQAHNYDPAFVKPVIAEILGNCQPGDPVPLRECLGFACSVVKPKLEAATDELKYFIEGINGRFVPPGGSGSPTRGKVNILPTGRNFYTLDPTTVPTRAAWEVGKQLADNLLKRYLQDEGEYPESVAIVVYAGESMKTGGDDVAEVLYLMGIKPKWLENTGKVIGLEMIPIEELRRPRIDVTLRISGLFRDTFPNLIELVEDAVTFAAGLEAEEGRNYVRKHIMQDVEKFKAEGMAETVAQEQAALRIFGCPPGTYGAGVDLLINSKNWKDSSDLGNIYTTWGGHAYGKKVHGSKVRDLFAHRLAMTDVTVKNESSMEIDMLDSDDFYNYHGGLVAAVKIHSGKMPRAYTGDSSDPSRPKVRALTEETARIMRARILNPRWFEGLQQHGYKGAQEIAGMVDFVFGWDATAEVVEDWMYDKISETYLFNDDRREWIQSVNPWAIHSITERLLEANQRGMWNTSEENLAKLKNLYLAIEGNIEEAL